MTKSNLQEEQFCSRCNAWGPSDMMLPLYRVSGPQGAPSLWMHHQCVEICSNTQFQAAMKRFETQVHSMADSQVGRPPGSIVGTRARVNLAVAADRANLSLQALKRAKAALEIASVDAEDSLHARKTPNQETAQDEVTTVRVSLKTWVEKLRKPEPEPMRTCERTN
jgi:hypothetical protein